MRVIFFGTPFFAKNILKIIEESCEILAIVTQPDRPFGRKQELKICEVKEYALKRGYLVFQPQALNMILLKQLLELKPDLFLVAAFGQIFPTYFLHSILCLNVHASILPHLRGASPLQEMILEEKQNFGVTIMQMQEGLDEGEIFAISYLNAQDNLPLQILEKRLSQLGGELAIKVFKKIKQLRPIPQNHCDSTVCKRIKKQAGLIDFSNRFYAKYLAFTPWPSIFLSSGLKILKMQLLHESNNAPYGQIIKINKCGVCVSCLEGVVEILEVQPKSRQKMGALDYIRGQHLKVGDQFC